jgi:hypothetical protein
MCGNHHYRDFPRAQKHGLTDKVTDAEKKGKARALTFFDEVDERMKRDSPTQYRLFLESKAAWESQWRSEQQDVLSSRRNMRGRQSNILLDSSILSPTQIDEELENHGRQVGPHPTAIIQASSSSHLQIHDTTILSTSKSSHVKNNDVSTDPSEKEITTPSWDQSVIESSQQPITPIASNNESSSRKGGVFSTISKTALMIKSANVNIPLADLFPTLYSTEMPVKDFTPKKHIDPVMIFDPDDFEAYEQAMTAVFTDDGTIKAISKFERKLADRDNAKRIVQKVKDWLLNRERIVEPRVMRERWSNVDEAWKNAKWMTALGPGEIEPETMFATELKTQQQLFLSLLQDKELGSSPSSEDETPVQVDEVTNTSLDPILFYEVTQHFVGSLGRYCARRARSTPMVVAWWKVKESGLLLRKDVTANFLYVCSTMGVADSIGMGSGVGAYLSDRKREYGREKNTIENEQSRFLIPEEVATYHDLSSKPTESSISLRVKALTSKGNAKSAEELVEAFKASDTSVLSCMYVAIY